MGGWCHASQTYDVRIKVNNLANKIIVRTILNPLVDQFNFQREPFAKVGGDVHNPQRRRRERV
ncbi:MAG: hypothetical protein BWY07_01114 [Candidatus Hydrogenedentes bacterium ADurb.Bin170]|nr:MAG: hypothetical protein BWY07_01114 [Candidatus Hydrogenedentes bacterium ADurb.Bin170]